MKKQYMPGFVLVTGIVAARAQSSYTTIQYNNKMQPALVPDLPDSTNDAEGSILEKLKQTGYNNNVGLPSLSNQKTDMYFKVVQKNNEERNNSTPYLLVSSGCENFVSTGADTTFWSSSKMFLNSFVEKTTAFSLEQDIKPQENIVKDSQNKLATLHIHYYAY
jgi:hypothetical protein